jgi:hypothetical protein
VGTGPCHNGPRPATTTSGVRAGADSAWPGWGQGGLCRARRGWSRAGPGWATRAQCRRAGPGRAAGALCRARHGRGRARAVLVRVQCWAGCGRCAVPGGAEHDRGRARRAVPGGVPSGRAGLGGRRVVPGGEWPG